MIPLIILAIESPDDREFMENLYLSYRWLMYAQIKSKVSDPWEIDDILQSSLEKLIDKIPLLRSMEKSQQINYVITTCQRMSLSYLRKKKRIDYLDNESLEAFGSTPNTPELWVLTQEHIENTYAAWQQLDQKTKNILMWKYKLEMSDLEIAEELGIKPNSVRMSLTRARENFKKELEKLE